MLMVLVAMPLECAFSCWIQRNDICTCYMDLQRYRICEKSYKNEPCIGQRVSMKSNRWKTENRKQKQKHSIMPIGNFEVPMGTLVSGNHQIHDHRRGNDVTARLEKRGT